MKTIILVRHAKTEPATWMQADFSRNLNERGLRDAPMMGMRLAKRGLKIDSIISSTANRAVQTAELIADQLQFPKKDIIQHDHLYHPKVETINDVISKLPEEQETVVIVCHNPGVTYWMNEQTGFLLDNMPTCGMVAFSVKNTWANWVAAAKIMNFIDFPKMQGMVS